MTSVQIREDLHAAVERPAAQIVRCFLVVTCHELSGWWGEVYDREGNCRYVCGPHKTDEAARERAAEFCRVERMLELARGGRP